ncbi:MULTISPECIES: hypothetical protein [Spiroplasma]|uniref:Uncharacterized protein n=1 Tax=Spiroplasma eriocheiris TaxID=315358 RepID=A0A0H3XM51_9MOLU|nr:hypothetical protein [Spiroplasma eriocheiris]AHF58237.1 hypothetical protein SPE_1123 [Spiroplasma eriocheiris CCTCC M 207170]AKM54674.1 hypothetical protein SERIO_v1c11210 [Spiroplasma eriocheiris]
MARKSNFFYAIYTVNDEFVNVYESVEDLIAEQFGITKEHPKFKNNCQVIFNYIFRHNNLYNQTSHYKWKIYKYKK